MRRAKTKHRGPTRVAADFFLNLIAHNVGPELKTTPEAARQPFEVDRTRLALSPTAACDPSATWAGSADQLAVPADDSTVAFMRLKRAVNAVDETLPDSGRVEQM